MRATTTSDKYMNTLFITVLYVYAAKVRTMNGCSHTSFSAKVTIFEPKAHKNTKAKCHIRKRPARNCKRSGDEQECSKKQLQKTQEGRWEA